MKKKENIFILVLVIIGLCGIMIYKDRNNSNVIDIGETHAAQAGELYGIHWKDYQQGMDLSESEKKPVFIYFYADWCSPCKLLRKTTLNDADIISYLNENYISIKVNVDKEKDLVRKFRINAFPTLIFVSFVSQKSDVHKGYLRSDQLMRYLVDVNEK